jgi:hypothetical protein
VGALEKPFPWSAGEWLWFKRGEAVGEGDGRRVIAGQAAVSARTQTSSESGAGEPRCVAAVGRSKRGLRVGKGWNTAQERP